jgi:hypothetical protein
VEELLGGDEVLEGEVAAGRGLVGEGVVDDAEEDVAGVMDG